VEQAYAVSGKTLQSPTSITGHKTLKVASRDCNLLLPSIPQTKNTSSQVPKRTHQAGVQIPNSTFFSDSNQARAA